MDVRPGVIKNYALRHANVKNGCLYAVYGISLHYENSENDYRVYAETPKDIKYFFNEISFNNYIKKLENRFNSAQSVELHYVNSDLKNKDTKS